MQQNIKIAYKIFTDEVLNSFSGFAYIICRDRIIYGSIDIGGNVRDYNEKPITDWKKYLIEARFYNNDKEIKVFKCKKKFYYRDSANDLPKDKLDTQQILLGNEFQFCGGNHFIKATESSGTEIYIPANAFLAKKDEKYENIQINDLAKLNNKRIAMQIEQYIDFENGCLASIVDYRIIGYKIV